MIVDYTITLDLAQHISAEQAFHYRIVPKIRNNGTLVLMTDAERLQELESELQIVLDIPLELEQIDSDTLQHLLTANYRKSRKSSSDELRFTTDFL